MLSKTCISCKQSKPLADFHKNVNRYLGHTNQCKECAAGRFNYNTKGIKEYQLVVNYFLVLDRIRGASYGELAKRYKLDRSNISKRVRGVLNCHQNLERKNKKLQNQDFSQL